ncbi:MAG: stage 0 sporulation family protein [Bacteroidia bacterium]
MSCSGCSSGRGHYDVPGASPAGCNNNGSCGTGGCNKLNVFDWLANMELPEGEKAFDIVEIRFKNSRKEFFRNVNSLPLTVGEVVAVESSPGHDMGVVSLTGELVRLQMKKRQVNFDSEEIKKVYRKAKPQDIEKWQEAQKLEVPTMYKARTFALRHNLQMKISDVEYQGDKTKAIFYYTADARVDFRELIKTLADEFKVRIEMRQIGARQEASRLGGIGACGRELCCATWLTDFRTVSTSAARYQQLSLNPLKLAGQCGKLKCCLNYELDSYMDAIKDFPQGENIKLKSKRGDAFHQKTDIFRRMMWYSYFDERETFIPLSVDRVKEIMELNAKGEFPEDISDKKLMQSQVVVEKEPDYEKVDAQDSLTRFDKKNKQDRSRGRNQGKPQHKKNTAGTNKPNPTVGPNQNKPRNNNPGNNKPNPNKQNNPANPKPNNNRQGNRGPGNKPNPNNNNRNRNNNNRNDGKKNEGNPPQ